jgi:hypothetical protein
MPNVCGAGRYIEDILSIRINVLNEKAALFILVSEVRIKYI